MPMAAISGPSDGSAPASATGPDLEEELRQALADFEEGRSIELTVEQLDAWAENGVVPWTPEFLD